MYRAAIASLAPGWPISAGSSRGPGMRRAVASVTTAYAWASSTWVPPLAAAAATRRRSVRREAQRASSWLLAL